MALNKFPSYEELRKNSPEILKIIETPIGKGDIVEISGYPGTGKTLVSGMMFTHCANKDKIYLTYAHMLLSYTKQGLGVNENIQVFDSYLFKEGGRALVGDDLTLEEKREVRISNLKSGEGKILFIDEAQDIPTDALAKLSLKFDSVVICGDKDQVIYERSMAGSDFFQEYENDLRRNDSLFNDKYILKSPGKLTKNYRNTLPIFEFAKYFQPDSEKIKDIQIMRKGGDKPQVWVGRENNLLDELVTLCINGIDNKEVVGIIAERSDDVDRIYKMLFDALKNRLGDNFNDNIINKYYYDKNINSRDRMKICEKCVNSNVIVSTIHSMKGLEFDIVIFWKLGDSSGWKFDALSRNKYYVGMTRAKDRLIICQNDESFGPYNLPDDSYEVHNIEGRSNAKSGSVFDDDEYEDLPF